MHSLPTHVGIAWKLVSDFNQIDSLFKEQELPYKVITHVCSCKTVHVQIVQQDDLRVETYKGTFFPMRFKSSLNPS